MSIEYTVGILDADAHLIDVQMDIANPDLAGQLVQLPNWIPGSYMIRDFSRNIVSISARCKSDRVELIKLDKSSWQAPAGLSSLSIHYRVYAWDLSVRTAHVDRTHAFFNGTSVFLCAQGFESVVHKVRLQRPEHDRDKQFELATTLPSASVDAGGFGEYEACDYDELIDHPVEMGAFKRIEFNACNVPHEVVFTGRCHFDEERVVRDLKRICEYEIGFFGSPAPYDRYVFLVMVVDAGYGGLEHRSSTALMITRENLPVKGDESMSDSYLNFLGLCSHEYFHNWNVKRIKPARFIPFELQAESYTQLLWFFEGITSYYDDLILLRSGLIDEERYLGVLAKTLTRVQRGPGRLTQSVTDSSFDAWHKFYKQDENAPNAIVSYYAKGALVALCLDSMMRQSSDNAVTLDALMADLWQSWLDTQSGLSETEPQERVAVLLGQDVSEFFDSALYATDELPLKSSLGYLGVELTWAARRSEDDMGGLKKPHTSDGASVPARRWIGANMVDAPGGVRLTQVINGSPAERAGLSAGDIVVALGGFSVTKSEVENLLHRFSQETELRAHFFRLGQLSECLVSMESAPQDTAVLEISDKASLKNWLNAPELKNG